MKKTLLFFNLLIAFSTQAQVSLKISKNYPAHIIYKIDDLLSIVKLDEDKQFKIAEKFKKIDSLANVSLVNGGSVKHLKSDYNIDTKFLKNILSTEELEQFAYESDKDNRFLAALISKSSLKLNSTQIKQIRQLNDSLDITPRKSIKETIQFYNLKLNKILNEQQYVELIKFNYKDQSLKDAKTDWERILKLKINKLGKEEEEFNQIVDFHFNKNSFLDRKADRFEKTQRDFFYLKANLMRPLLLVHADILTNPSTSTNKYASLIRFEKELNLSQSQIDTLLVKYKQFEEIIIENREIDVMDKRTLHKELPSQFENIIKIITAEKVNKWLSLKNKEEGMIKAYKSWEKLELEGLTTGLDKQKVISELGIYHLKLLIALEKAKSLKSKENLFLIRDVEQTKPEILQKLDNIARAKAKNENAKKSLAW